ncbi:MAG: nucleotidyltransferase substrate binding protein [Opitutales bacterium]|nr:nucleotidyltransferase substrate binding protein [Opitutales bacterium]
MSNADPIRWQQRLQQFEKASGLLFEALERSVFELSQLEQEGVIQRFEYTFELAWKTLKDLLFYEGFDLKSPRDVIRQAFTSEYLNEEDTEQMIDALNKRNLLSHTYEEATAREALTEIQDNYAPALHRLLRTLQEIRANFA